MAAASPKLEERLASAASPKPEDRLASDASPKPEDRIAFANKLAQVRAKDVDGEYQKELEELEFEYQFILLRSLELFHKEMRSGSLPERLHEIKEKLTGTVGKFDYQANLPAPNWNWNNIICKQCRKMGLRPMPGTNELFCPRCGVLETLDGAYFDDEELHKCGDDYKIVKPRRTNRKSSSRTSWKNTRRSSQQKVISYPLKPLGTPMRSSRELKNIYQSESRSVCSLQDLEQYYTVRKREVRSALLLAASATKRFG